MAKIKKGEKQVNIELPAELWAEFDLSCEMFKKKQAVGAALYHFIVANPAERFELVNDYLKHVSAKPDSAVDNAVGLVDKLDARAKVKKSKGKAG